MPPGLLLYVLAGLAALALLAGLVVLSIAAWVAHKMTLVPRLPLWGHPADFPGLIYEEVSFPSRRDRVTLRGWYLPAPADDRCIILAAGEEHHRNSPGIKALSLGRDLAARGYSVLLFDYRARGESDGKRNSNGDRERWDLLGALDWVTARGIPKKRIGLIGFSLGAAVTILVAAREPEIPAIVCDSGYLDAMPQLERMPFYWFYLPRWFARPIALAGKWFFGADFSQVRPVKVVGKIAPRPVYFIHAVNDHVVPYQETVELFKISNNAKNRLWLAPNSGHVHIYNRHPQEYVERVSAFFKVYIK